MLDTQTAPTCMVCSSCKLSHLKLNVYMKGT